MINSNSQYKKELQSLTEMFSPTYSPEDLGGVLEECKGDLSAAIDMLTSGRVQTWKVAKPKVLTASSQNVGQAAAEKANIAIAGRPFRGASSRGRARGGRAGYTRNDDRQRNTRLEPEAAETFGTFGTEYDEVVLAVEKVQLKQTAPPVGPHTAIAKDVQQRHNVNGNNKSNNGNPNNGKKSNWASIVKGPEVSEPIYVPEIVAINLPTVATPIVAQKASKKFNLQKKDSQSHSAAQPHSGAPVTPLVSQPEQPKEVTAAVRDWNQAAQIQDPTWSQPQIVDGSHDRNQSVPAHNWKPASPLVKASSQTSPLIARSMPSPVADAQDSMPPGLVRPAKSNHRKKESDGKKVVLPSQVAQTSQQVQFGSFGIKSTGGLESNPKSPERVEETAANGFQFPQPTAGQNSRPTSATEQQIGAAGQYQQPQGFGTGNYSMYEAEQQREMGYYVPDPPNGSYPKYGQGDSTLTNASQSPSTQHSQSNQHGQHLGQHQAFQPYPYYPYYINQYQQAPYQPQYQQQQHFGGKNSYGQQGFQTTPATPQGPAAAKTGAAAQGQAGYYNGGSQGQGQAFYPSGYEEDPYGGKTNYAGQSAQAAPSFFGGQSAAKPDYKRQSRPPYEKTPQTTNFQGQSGQNGPNGQAAQQPSPYAPYGGSQFPVHYQPLMMHPQDPQNQQGYSQRPNQPQQGYWNGN